MKLFDLFVRSFLLSPALILAIAVPVRATGVTGVVQTTSAPFISHAGARPNSKGTLSATHYFDLHVQGIDLARISIDLPKGTSVSHGVGVTNQSGRKVNAAVSINGRTTTIVFSQPVLPGNTLEVSLKGIRYGVSRDLHHIWLDPVHGRGLGMTQDIPFGLARIQTYSP